MRIRSGIPLLFAVVLCFLLFGGCTMPFSNQILAPTNGNDQIMSDYFEKSIAAIENKDAVSFHELFSEEARKEKAAELLTEIEFILDFY